MTVDDLVHNSAEWLNGTGQHSEIVISSRARLARNIKSIPFANYGSDRDLSKVVDLVLSAKKQSTFLKDASFLHISELSKIERQVLLERHLISPELAEKESNGGILIGSKETLSVMVNEEDHLRLQAIQSGLQLKEVWSLVDRMDDELSGVLEYSFSEKLGYLTACLTNTGTGLRLSVLIHLPALVLTQEIDKVIRRITQTGFALRGFYGEGTEVLGNLFQISNQITIGKSETQIVESLDKLLKEIIENEQNAREVLLKTAKPQIEDKIWRAFGILENARILTNQEFMNLSSAMRLGRSVGILPYPETRAINELMVNVQPSHIRKLAEENLEATESDVFRANLVRKKIRSG